MKQLVIFLLAALAFTNLDGQTNTGNIEGSLQNSRKEPLSGLSVQVPDSKFSAVTDEEGLFSLRNLPPGNYTLIFSGVGYHLSRENIVVTSGKTTEVHFQLNETTRELDLITIGIPIRKRYLRKVSTSGTRLPLALVETPQTIQVIPSQVIQDQQAQNLNDVVKNMTGTVSNNMYTSYTMRGFLNSYYNQFITFDGFIGNMYQWTQLVQLYNIERVEQIAGPASALYSTGSPGGVINMITKPPLEKKAYSLNLVTGSWGLLDVFADLGGPLTKNGKLLYRLNIGYNHQNSFRPHQFNENLVIAPSIAYRISAKTNLLLDYAYAGNNSRYGQDHGGLMLMNPDSTYNWKGVDNKFLFNSPKDYSHIRNNNVTLRFSHLFNDRFRLDLMSRYIWSNQDAGEHYGNYFADNFFTVLPDSMQRNYNTWKFKPFNFQNSIYATYSMGKEAFKHTIIAGFDYQYYGDRYNRYVNGPAPSVSFTNPDFSQDAFNYQIDSLTFVGDVKMRYRQLGAYIQDLVSINDRIKILLSGRYEDYRFVNKPNSADNYFQENDSSVAHVFLPRLGLVYSFNKNHSAYGSYCESFQPQYDNSRGNGGPFPPQKGKQFEIGYKGLFFGSKLLTSFALYSIKFENVLATDPSDPTGIRQIPIQGLTSKGTEVTFQGNINQFSIIAGYAYNHVVFSDNSPLGPKGGRYDNSPNHIANFWVKYSLPNRMSMKGLSFSLGGKYVGDRVGWATNQHFLMPAYFVLDALVNYTFGRFNIGLNGFNLLNQNYVLGYYASDLMVQVGTPVNWKLSVRYTIK